jgi:hypothetical protein
MTSASWPLTFVITPEINTPWPTSDVTSCTFLGPVDAVRRGARGKRWSEGGGVGVRVDIGRFLQNKTP